MSHVQRQSAPITLNWVNRSWLSFRLIQALKAQRKADIARAKLMAYASQFGMEVDAMRWIQPDLRAADRYSHKGPNQPMSQASTAAPTAPATPFQASETKPPSDFAITPPEQSQSQEFNPKKDGAA